MITPITLQVTDEYKFDCTCSQVRYFGITTMGVCNSSLSNEKQKKCKIVTKLARLLGHPIFKLPSLNTMLME